MTTANKTDQKGWRKPELFEFNWRRPESTNINLISTELRV